MVKKESFWVRRLRTIRQIVTHRPQHDLVPRTNFISAQIHEWSKVGPTRAGSDENLDHYSAPTRYRDATAILSAFNSPTMETTGEGNNSGRHQGQDQSLIGTTDPISARMNLSDRLLESDEGGMEVMDTDDDRNTRSEREGATAATKSMQSTTEETGGLAPTLDSAASHVPHTDDTNRDHDITINQPAEQQGFTPSLSLESREAEGALTTEMQNTWYAVQNNPQLKRLVALELSSMAGGQTAPLGSTTFLDAVEPLMRVDENRTFRHPTSTLQVGPQPMPPSPPPNMGYMPDDMVYNDHLNRERICGLTFLACDYVGRTILYPEGTMEPHDFDIHGVNFNQLMLGSNITTNEEQED